MKSIPLLLLLSLFLFGFEKTIKLQLGGIAYNNYNNEIVTQGDGRFRFENDLFITDAKVEFLYSSEYKERRYLLLNELYITKDYEEYTLRVGKEIKYWGELEGYNIADIYNQKNYMKDPFDKNAKYGAIGADITRYFEENSLEFGVKIYEADNDYPQEETPYAPFILQYDAHLHVSDSRYTPTLYIMANIVNDTWLENETKLILLRGYDTKRYFVPISLTTLAQYAYRVNKALFLSHIIYNDTLFKTELSYTDVLHDTQMSDYTQLSFGVEKGFYELFSSDMTVYTEYYRYLYKDDTKIKNVDISEIYDNDIFVALRIALNDVGSSELKTGVLQDINKKERVFKIEGNSRFFEKFIIHGEYLNISAKTNDTLLSKFDKANRFTLSLEYTF